MRRTLIVTTSLVMLASGAAHAGNKSSKEEAIGVGLGATVGAVAGGPIGGILGAAIGAKFGDSFHNRNERVSELEASLAQSSAHTAELQRTVAGLNSEIGSLDGELRRLREVSRPELVALMNAGIEMDLLFRTDERVLADSTNERIAELAASISDMPDIKVRLDGFADERGAATYNSQLSEDRARHVRDVLIANGVDESRIAVTGHGEAPAPDTTADSYALQGDDDAVCRRSTVVCSSGLSPPVTLPRSRCLASPGERPAMHDSTNPQTFSGGWLFFAPAVVARGAATWRSRTANGAANRQEIGTPCRARNDACTTNDAILSDRSYSSALPGRKRNQTRMDDLVERRCKPCEGGVEPLDAGQAAELLAALHPDWSLEPDGKSIVRDFRFPAFSRTIAFVNAVAWIATVEGHHPEMLVNYGNCIVRYTTTAIGGLSDNDFICAAKVDRISADS